VRPNPKKVKRPQRIAVLTMVLLSPMRLCAQSGSSPRDVVELYCKLDASGKQLAVLWMASASTNVYSTTGAFAGSNNSVF
jgi:hypothetical protein